MCGFQAKEGSFHKYQVLKDIVQMVSNGVQMVSV
jgi:hypothetical protein